MVKQLSTLELQTGITVTILERVGLFKVIAIDLWGDTKEYKFCHNPKDARSTYRRLATKWGDREMALR